MKKAVIKSIFVAAFLFSAAGSAHAASTVYFSIQYHDNAANKTSIVLNRAFTLPGVGNISLVDDGGANRTINAQSVLAVLSDIQNITNSYQITDLKYYPSFSPPSLYLRCMAVSVSNNPACENWQYWINGITDAEYGPDGMDQHLLNGGEVIYIYFGDYGTNPTAVDKSSFQLFSPGPIGGSIQGPSSPVAPAPTVARLQFKSDKAIDFLARNQNKDGSFGTSPMFSDWVAVALGSSQGDNLAKTKLKNYLLTNPDAGPLLTDYEMRAMALMSLGINPYSGTPTNYIQKILGSFDGKQFGDQDLINDDIFALLVLIKAGYRNSDQEIGQDISFLLQNQKSSGSFGDVDLTVAAVQALSQVATTNDVKDALAKAKAFLIRRQEDSGGFGNIYSTSWAMQAIAGLGEDANSWVKNNHSPQDYLQFSQASDGGMQESDTIDNRIWGTSYAIPAATGKDWGSILTYFSKPASVPSPEVAKPIAQSSEQDLQTLEQKISELQKQVAKMKAQIELATTLQTVEQKVHAIALQTQAIQLQVAILEKPSAPENSNLAVATSAMNFDSSASEQSEPAGLAAGVIHASSIWNAFFIIAAAFGIFLLLGGFSLVNPFLRSRFFDK